MDSKPDSTQPENPPSEKFYGSRTRFSHDRSLPYCSCTVRLFLPAYSLVAHRNLKDGSRSRP
jgi:hypothetical protein